MSPLAPVDLLLPLGVLAALAAGAARDSADNGGPRWDRVPHVCRVLQAEGWRPLDPLGSGPGPGSATIGGKLALFVCKLDREWPARGKSKAPRLELFAQRGGGGGLSVRADLWDEAQREPTLREAADLFARLAGELRLANPELTQLLDALRRGVPESSDVDELRWEVTTETRRERLVSEPDLRPEDVPLLAVTVAIRPQPADCWP